MRAASRLATLRCRALPLAARRGAAAAPNLLADLTGKIIVNAGAGNPPSEEHGLGAMTSIALARQGATVVSVSNVAINCETVTETIKKEGNTGDAIVADCTQYESVSGLVKSVKDKYGRVDVLINSGIHMAVPMGFGRMTPERWQQGVDINLNAHFNLIHGFLPMMLEAKKGNIIHFTTFVSAIGLGMEAQRHSYFRGRRLPRR